jgi:malonyl CoA-acyl carrier protein transacylase
VHVAARLAQREVTQPVDHLVQVTHLVAHGAAEYLEHAAGDHLADLAFGVSADDPQHPRPAHDRAPWRIVAP